MIFKFPNVSMKGNSLVFNVKSCQIFQNTTFLLRKKNSYDLDVG